MGLHGLLLLGAYYLSFQPPSLPPAAGYSIALTTADAQPNEVPAAMPAEAPGEIPLPPVPSVQEAPAPVVPPAPPEVAPDQAPADQPPAAVPAPSPAPVPAAPIPPPIDERGLYTTYQGKHTGAQLELPGWVWDDVPQPQDDTDESGKIVFEIKIDALGEVIAIKTLEKTVSPLVAESYKEALTQLTFSKTATDRVYAPVSTGKVTFIIQAK